MLAGVGYSIISEFFKPTPTENNGPITFNEQVGPQSKVLVPMGNAELSRPTPIKIKTKSAIKYSGLQIVQRPNFGKVPPGTMVGAKFANWSF